MPRSIPLVALVVGLVVTVPSSAQVGSGKIVYATVSGGLVAVNPDGSGRTSLRSSGGRPVWSPDGTKIAFVESDNRSLSVIDADGTGEHVVAARPEGALNIGSQAWSPDGSRIAFSANSSIYTASSAGGDVRFVTSGAQYYGVPGWSPDGTSLTYTSSSPSVYVIAPDGSGRSELSAGYSPAWSPNGASIAFVRVAPGESAAGVWLVRADGSELHKVASRAEGPGYPAWSPDGRQIAFTGADDYGVRNVFVVNADGSNLQRLTKPRSDSSEEPSWSPDGDQILFGIGRLMRMNSDGSCVEPVAVLPVAQALWGWSWQPPPAGPPLGTRRCSAIGLDWAVSPANSHGAFGVEAIVANEGTEPLTDARLVASTDNSLDLFIASPYCDVLRHRISCSLHLDRGQSDIVYFRIRPRSYNRDARHVTVAKVELHATAPGTLLVTGRETAEATTNVLTCSVHDPGRGRIDGTSSGDRICGRTGRDLIHPGLGLDFVEAGSGNDVIFAASDYESRDKIFCGRGYDVVVADREDRVAKDCERVRRAG